MKKIYNLAKEYFIKSEERYKALLLLLGILLAVVSLVILTTLFASWSVVFWSALSEMSMPLYMSSIQTFVMLTASYIGVSILKDYLIGLLTISWRSWLTKKLFNKYTSEDGNNYLDLERHASEIKNPAARIQDDVKLFVEQTLSLGINLLQSTLTIALFIGNLWAIGGAVTIASITIPGYLVWMAILYSGIATAVTHLIGRSLAKATNNQQNLEAEFRSNMEHLSNNAESVALDRGERYYQHSLKNQVEAINKNSYKILGVKINLSAVSAFFQQIAGLVPYVLAAPLYFTGLVNLGQLMEIGFSFFQIQFSLSWFSNSYESISNCSVSASRIAELEDSLKEDGLSTTSKSIVVREGVASALSISNLNIAYPSSANCMMRKLNLTLRPGENTLIKAPSGFGKSSLFKAIAGTWKYGSGDICVTKKRMCFLPQRPSLPNDTLKAVLAYPEPVETYTDEQCQMVLREVGELDKFIGDLNTKDSWSRRLSAGEQQRVSFARALLKKPDWLFLDEATASLDAKSEQRMYRLVKDKLKNTTFVSIAHRSTVTKFHNRVVNLGADENRNLRYDKNRATLGVLQ